MTWVSQDAFHLGQDGEDEPDGRRPGGHRVDEVVYLVAARFHLEVTSGKTSGPPPRGRKKGRRCGSSP